MKYFYTVVIALLLAGCGPHKMFEGEKEVPLGWSSDEGINFVFNVDDTLNAYNVIMEITHEESFGFQNLYTNIVTDFPDGSSANSVVSLDVRKTSGVSQGSCSGTTCTVPFLIQKDVFFDQLGQFGITLFQYSRKDTIHGVKNISLKVEQIENQD